MDRTTHTSGTRLVERYKIPKLPPPVDLESQKILKKLPEAHRRLAELKGLATSIPNQGILIDTLVIQEAAASSEIENIVTTQDEVFQINHRRNLFPSPRAKEVSLYGSALHLGFEKLRENQGVISNNLIIALFQNLKLTTGDFRRQPGTALKNDRTGEIVYVPPQSFAAIQAEMNNLERFINDSEQDSLDPIVRMAVIHHQFESIHPFPDGNGRVGRILNVLFLCKEGLLDIPILYISRYITENKSEYYRLLQHVRDTGIWEDWILYMIEAVTWTSKQTKELVVKIRELLGEYKKRIKDQNPRMYSHELVNNIFRHPYTRIEYVVEEVGVTRQTAAKYLDELCSTGLLRKRKIAQSNYYINERLVDLLVERSGDSKR